MDNKKKNRSPLKNPLLIFLVISVIATVILNMVMLSLQTPKKQEISYSEFLTMLDENKVDEVILQSEQIVIYEKYDESQPITTPKTTEFMKMMGIDTDAVIEQAKENSRNVYYTGYIPDDRLLADLDSHGVKYSTPIQHNSPVLDFFLTWILPLVVIYLLFFILTRSMSKKIGGGGGIMGIGQSNAKMYNVENATGVTFADVAGQEEAKESLDEIVDYLHNPSKYLAIGAKQPKGALLVGPPGTGKTLLAKAVAGEAKVPFFSLSGSEFVEMFVGVGASRVRDLFKQASAKAPCIIFIDEIDAIGKSRDNQISSNDEREQTLNQLLIEMDGFDGNENIIVIAATNRSDVLDPALLRPGRFDRKVLVGRPDVKGREAILKVHAKNKPLAEDVDLKVVAQQTPGFVGADLENVLNEAALVAARRSKTRIDASDIDEAEDRVIAGPSKKDRQVSEHERKVVAYHEAGHTIVGLTLSSARDVHKVTIVPRGRAGGYMISLPKEDQMLSSKDELKEQLAGLMGGRVAEEIIFNVQTSGASNDFEQATQLARAMVTEYGMSEKLGPVQYEGNHAMNPGQFTTDKSYSAHTAQLIDEEIRSLLVEAHDKAAEIINANRETHALIAEALLKYETLDAGQIKSIYETGKMPEDSLGDSEEDNHALSYDEVKERIENKNKDEEE